MLLQGNELIPNHFCQAQPRERYQKYYANANC